MKPCYFICALLCLTTALSLSQSHPFLLINQSSTVVIPIRAPQTARKADAKILDRYGKLPLSFEANHGQTDGRVKFLSHAGGYTFFLTGDEGVLALRGKAMAPAPKGASGFQALEESLKLYPDTNSADRPPSKQVTGGVLRMKLRRANLSAKVSGVDELAGTSSYFIGNDPAKWRTNIPTYAKVKYEGIYSGIDLVYYGNQRQLEFDFIVSPGADPRRIAFDIRGAKQIRRDSHGDLVFKTDEDEIHWHKPFAYQEKAGTRQEIASRYTIIDANGVGFELAGYDASRPLYIDPVIYSTDLAGGGPDIAVDSAGSAYLTSSGSVNKLNPAGTALIYSVYLDNEPSYASIAVDIAGDAYVTGSTSSTDFPTTPDAFQSICGGTCISNAFVTEINPAGTALIYSTYLGGSGNDHAFGVAVNSAGDAYITGTTDSTDFPVTPGAFQTACCGAFITEVNPTGTALVYSTYLDNGSAYGIALDGAGDAYVTGYTNSTEFPTTPGVVQGYCDNCVPYEGYAGDAFATKLNPTGSALVYSTYLGGNIEDFGKGIAVDGTGAVYVAGFQVCKEHRVGGGESKCGTTGIDHTIVYGINPTGSALAYEVLFSGGESSASGIVADTAGNAYVTGSGVAPTTPGAFQRTCSPEPFQSKEWEKRRKLAVTRPARGGCGDPFVTKIAPWGSLTYSTYLSGYGAGSGIATDGAGNVYLSGDPVTKFDPVPPTTTKLFSSLNPSSYGQEVTFTAFVTSNAGTPPDGETVAFMNGTTALGTGTLSGGSATLTTSTLPVGKNLITAVYSGDSNFFGSTSKAVKQAVDKAASQVR
jgi:hypothetical protein